jgi:putative glutamine amidotransferase
VIQSGHLPFLVPNSLFKNQQLNLWLERFVPEGILLSGGNDLGEYPDRDHTELALIDYAFTKKLPLLGICRGMQILGQWAGVQTKPVEHHVRKVHHVHGVINKHVNSYHQQSLISCPKDFSVLAHDKDQEIEAIKHNTLPWEAWMWHPEREHPYCNHDLTRFKELSK